MARFEWVCSLHADHWFGISWLVLDRFDRIGHAAMPAAMIQLFWWSWSCTVASAESKADGGNGWWWQLPAAWLRVAMFHKIVAVLSKANIFLAQTCRASSSLCEQPRRFRTIAFNLFRSQASLHNFPNICISFSKNGTHYTILYEDMLRLYYIGTAFFWLESKVM